MPLHILLEDPTLCCSIFPLHVFPVDHFAESPNKLSCPECKTEIALAVFLYILQNRALFTALRNLQEPRWVLGEQLGVRKKSNESQAERRKCIREQLPLRKINMDTENTSLSSVETISEDTINSTGSGYFQL